MVDRRKHKWKDRSKERGTQYRKRMGGQKQKKGREKKESKKVRDLGGDRRNAVLYKFKKG